MKPTLSAVRAVLGLLALWAALAQLAAFALAGAASAYATYAAWTLAGVAALAAMFAVAWRMEGLPWRRGGWLVVAGVGAWLAGAAFRAALAFGAPASFLNVADGLWLAFVALAVTGITIRSPRGLLSYRLFVLDALPLVSLAAAVTLSVSRATHASSDLHGFVACLFALYVAPAAVTLQLMGLDGFRRATSAWWYLAAGWIVLVVAAMTWPAYGRDASPMHPPTWQAALWTAGMLFLTASAIRRTKDPPRAYFQSSERESSRRAVPASLATFGLLLLAVFERTHLGVEVLALLAFTSFAVRSGIARQAMGRIVADLVRSREALEESEWRFRSIFESAAVGVTVTDSAGRVLEANRALEGILGLGPGEMIGRDFSEFTHPDDVAPSLDRLNELSSGGRNSYTIEKRYVRPDGQVVWGRASVAAVRDRDGAPLFNIGVLENIDVRRRAEADLAAAEARYRTLVEELPFVTYIAGLDPPTATYVSPQIEALFGYSAEEWTSHPDLYSRVLHPEDRDRVLRDYAEMRRRGDSFESEYRVVASDGRVVWIRDAAVVVRDESNRPLHVQGHMMDVSARRRAEEAGAQRQAILEAIAGVSEVLLSTSSWEDAADDVLRLLGEAAGVSRAYIFENRTAWDGRELSYQRFEWAAPGVESFLDDAALQGFDLGEVHGRLQSALAAGGIVSGTLASFSPEERREFERQGIRSLLIAPIMAGGRWWGWFGFDECTIDRVWAEGEIDAVRAAAGTLGAAIQREHAETTEREAVQRLQAVIEASPAAIVGLDRSGCVMMWNPAAETMFGWRAEEILGRPNPNVPPGGQQQFEGLLSRGISGESWNDLEIVRRHRDGTELHLSSSAAPLRDASGTIAGAVAVLVGIDERKAAEHERERLLAAEREARAEAEAAREQLAEQNEKLRELDALKDEFVALVSHELRTPLTSILGYLDLALDPSEGRLSKTQREYLSVVERNSRRLLSLVGDLLFLAQVDAGKLAFERAPVDLVTLGSECVEAARPSAAAKAIQLNLHAQPVELLVGDRVRLTQLLDNLMSNAVKFTPSGGSVDVTIEQRGMNVVLSVADTGIGVSKEEQQRLFERFFRTANATREAIQGTGLGLAITKTIVEGHGGRITFTSQEGVGTTFRVELPLPLAMAA